MKFLDQAIQKCEELSLQTDELCFVFSYVKEIDKDIEEDLNVQDTWVVTTEDMLKIMPSRIPIYDTHFKETSIDRRFDKAYQAIASIRFEPSLNSNFGRGKEQVFIRSFLIEDQNVEMTLRLKPNLVVTIDWIAKGIRYDLYRGYPIQEFMMKCILTNIQSIETNQNTRDIIIDWLLQENPMDNTTKLLNIDGYTIGTINSSY